MICNAIILFTVGTHLVPPHPSSEHTLPFRISGFKQLISRTLSQLGSQNFEGHVPTLVLGSHIDPNGDTCGSVRGDNTRVCLVTSLTSGTSPTGGLDFHIIFIELEPRGILWI